MAGQNCQRANTGTLGRERWGVVASQKQGAFCFPSHSAQRQMSIFTQLPGVSNSNSLSALLVGNTSGRAYVDTPQRVPHRAGVAVCGQGSTHAL